MTAATATEIAPVTTREGWLVSAINALGAGIFADAAITLPAVRVSVGWPGGRGKKNTVIGQCWNTSAAADGVAQLFISPVLDDAARVLDVLIHEMIHAVDDCQNGHKGPFAKMAKRVGLTGKMTATVASPELAERLASLAEELGAYPHAALTNGGSTSGPKKQGTRMLKVECPEDGYTIRTTAKWLEVGLPVCPCGTEMVQA